MSNNHYWTEETDRMLFEYRDNPTDDNYAKIRPAIDKIIENIINSFKVSDYIRESYQNIKNMCEAFIFELLPKMDPKRGKPFSYITFCTRRFLVQLNKKGYNNNCIHISLDALQEEREFDIPGETTPEDNFDVYLDQVIAWYADKKNLESFPKMQRIYFPIVVKELLKKQNLTGNGSRKNIRYQKMVIQRVGTQNYLSRGVILSLVNQLRKYNEILRNHYVCHGDLNKHTEKLSKAIQKERMNTYYSYTATKRKLEKESKCGLTVS